MNNYKYAMYEAAHGKRGHNNSGAPSGWQSGMSYSSSTPAHFAPNAVPAAHFRSAAEASLDSSSKFRQLPCKTLIAVGTCPYGERCVFLHDPRLICHSSHSISRLKNKEDSVVDSFFWPLANHDQPAQASHKKADHNFRPYTIPPPNNDQFRMHDQALYSLWSHYVEFCRIASKEHKGYHAGPKLQPQDQPMNAFINAQRLPVFQLLSSSNGSPISREQFQLATNQEVAAAPHRQSPTDMTLRALPGPTAAPVKGRVASPTSVYQRNVWSPDERFPEMLHALTKQNSREKMMQRSRAHSGEISSGFPSYMSECDDSVGGDEDWNTTHQLIGADELVSQSWM